MTPRCGTITPFGRPVEPEVYITYARSSAEIAGSAPAASSRAAPLSSVARPSDGRISPSERLI